MNFDFLKDEKVLAFLGGGFAATYGWKALKSNKARQLYVNGLAAGMKLQQDARVMFQDLKEQAEDLCYDAQIKNSQNGHSLNTNDGEEKVSEEE